MNWIMWLSVGAGGAIGAMTRVGVIHGAARYESLFPFGTLAVNIAGCILMGIFLALCLQYEGLQAWRPFIAAGFLGGLTTFSTFSADFFNLVNQNRWQMAMVYGITTNIVGIAALVTGFWFTRKVLGY